MVLASTLSDVIVGLLPLIVGAVFVIFLTRRAKSRPSPMIAKLEEMRQELERIRHAVEHDPYRS